MTTQDIDINRLTSLLRDAYNALIHKDLNTPELRNKISDNIYILSDFKYQDKPKLALPKIDTKEIEYPFTEGPWKITFSRDGKEALIDNGFIASVNTDDNERGEANTKLIARSKDMFILIRDLVDAMDMAEIPPVNNDLYKRACEILKVGKV